MEHTDSKKIAKEIATDHIYEIPDYYTNSDYGIQPQKIIWVRKNLLEFLKKKWKD